MISVGTTGTMPFVSKAPAEDDISLEPIAICGMGCRLPGNVDSPSSLWDLLLQKRSGNSSKVPSSRFNIDAHYHKNNERPGSFNVLGGYFIDGPAENFDPTFFNLTPVEAMWLDPQQRKMLEVCYEAIESAGLTLESLAGSNTGVYVGCFTADYQQMTFKDPDFRHSYAATGVDPGIISNRIGNVFDLHGPSFTINTACSSSVYAIHNACHALRAGDCEAALVGGVNLILTVDQHMNTAKLGVLSPSSFCHTFDESADGYGRGEGAGALFLKKLSDAVRDGDVVGAVIRSSSVNTNGKVPGYGITFPNMKGQETVIRTAYKRANLDPDKTAYFECHGTGTAVGDPIEVQAVSKAMNDTRSLDNPLIIGAIKPNIGHSEAASGIFAVMKAVLMVENGLIPGVAGLQRINPQIDENKLNVRVSRETMQWPAGFVSRRASVSSFGYGGTNGHIIIEDANSLVRDYMRRRGLPKALATYDHSSTKPLLITFSAHDKATLLRNLEAHAKVSAQYYLVDLAHTLNMKRSRMAQRGYLVANESTVAEDMSSNAIKIGSSSKGIQNLAFIFTGQGAQWAGLGREAIKTFPLFRKAIRKLDRILKSLEHPPNFSIEEELSAPAETSRIYNANVAQPTLVATEIAIVDLLASWGVVPTATTGHSAGEYAAAYAAGLASAPEIIIAAYYRGYCLERFAPTGGSMLAVGKGVEELKEYLPNLDSQVVVACENSPSSVTLSGPSSAIREVQEKFTEEKIFAKELKTGMAYHSPQMNSVAGPMVELTAKAYKKLDSYDKDWRLWRMPTRTMISSVTGRQLTASDVGPEYWASNLTGRVMFSGAVKSLAEMESLSEIGGYVEIGPHSALAGPFKQICQAHDIKGLTYFPTLIRGKDSARSLLNTAGELFINSYPVDLESVNRVESRGFSGPTAVKRDIKPLTLVDLPPYQWNYEKMFFAEPRMSAEYRQLPHARHDLLGSKMLGLSQNSMVWRNLLRLRDIPWLKDHKLGGSIMFPAAGHMALAIEATRQHCELNKIDVIGTTIRDFELKRALIIPETDAGIEIQLRLSRISTQDGVPAFSFVVESLNNDEWTINSEGLVMPITAGTAKPTWPHPVNPDALTQRHTGKRWNNTFHRVGFEYGPSFNSLDKIRTKEKVYEATCQIPVQVASNLMIDESRYLLHPSTVDCLLQLCIISIHAGSHDMPWGVVPIKFDEVTILQPSTDVGKAGQAIAWNCERADRARNFKTDGQLSTESGEIVLDIKGLHTVAYEAALPPQIGPSIRPLPYMGTVWKPWSSSRETEITSAEKASVVLGYSPLHSAVPNALRDNLAKMGFDTKVKSIQDIDPAKDTNILLYNPTGNLLTEVETETFDALKEIIPSGATIVWLTSGVNEGTCVLGGAVAGFLRVLREEQKMSKLSVLDFDKAESFDSIARCIVDILHPADDSLEYEYWLYKNVLHTNFIIPNEGINNRMTVDEENLVEKPLPKGQLFQAIHNGAEFVFKPSEEFEKNSINPSEVTIQVDAFEFHDEDIKAPVQGPRLVSGTIIETGNAVSSALLRKNVLAWTSDPYKTLVRTLASACVDCSPKTSRKLLGGLSGLCQAADSLKGITSENWVLLLPTSNDALRSYAKLSKTEGFRLTVVSENKNPLNGFSGAYPDLDAMLILSKDNMSEIYAVMEEAGSSLVVVAQDFSPFSQEVWRQVPAYASFILNEKKQGTLSVPPSIDPFNRGARFAVTSLNTSFKTNVSALGELLRLCLTTSLKFPLEIPGDVDFATLRDVSKTPRDYNVVSYNYDSENVAITPTVPKLTFSPENVYLLVGCLGGLGRSLASWMIERGAKHLAFISRTGVDKPEAAKLIELIRRSGAFPQVFRGDAGNLSDVTRAVKEITKQRPIKGVVHAAMVLQDGMLGPGMSVDKFRAALGPKINGAQVLHNALQGHDLDFFVVTSSISATIGQPGQSNYGAANSFLDNFAWQRNLKGLPATSLVLPMVLGVGVVAENNSLEEKITRRGMYGIDEPEMLRGFEAAMSQPVPKITEDNMHITQADSTIILGLEPSRLVAALNAAGSNTDIAWIKDSRFSELQTLIEEAGGAGANQSSNDAGGSISEQLVSTWESSGYDAALNLAAGSLMQKCSSILMIDLEDFELEGKSIRDYGLDSMIGAELRNWLFKELKLNIAFQELLSATLSFKGLAIRVLEGYTVKF